MCVPNLEYQLLNPTTQVALFAVCIGLCTNIQNIRWNIYQGSDNSSSNGTQWILFNGMILYENVWFFGNKILLFVFYDEICLLIVLGTNTNNFTAIDTLFLNNPEITLWRFEVVYQFLSEKSTSALNFIINPSPDNGSCSMNPLNGTTTTLFTVSCPGWFDADGIKDYSLYGMFNFHSNKNIINTFFNIFSMDNRHIAKSNDCFFNSI